MSEQYGLGDTAMLEKVDKLFACGVGDLVNLPQIVVVGDQSSGKSSVLEGLIKKPIPRDSGLCTRFATQIVFRRAVEKRVVVSIVPSLESSQEHRQSIEAWGREVADLDTNTFSKIMQEAHEQMGLIGEETTAIPRPTFSDDVLRLEISGPSQEHLSVIDVPGIFKIPTEGLTTKADIDLVRCMVRSYMENPRSVMLTVIPANVDVATQEIIELATDADPSGERTLGVFTKPDLVDRGAEPAVVENCKMSISTGTSSNRSSSARNRHGMVNEAKVGIDSLRCRLKDILSSLIKKEFPKVKTEIRSRVTDARRLLASLGPERESSPDQMAYLTGIATEYQRLVSFALCANHGAHEAFEKYPSLRLAPAIVARMKAFSEDMATYGATYAFKTKMPEGWKNLPLTMPEDEENIGVAEVSLEGGRRFDSRVVDDHEDLVDIVPPVQSLPLPRSDGIHAWLRQVFQGNRGFELGTFNPSILGTTMRKQCSKWCDVSLGFVGDVITLVHRFVETALDATCPDQAVRQCLGSKLSEELLARYQTAIARSKFLLEVEHSDIPITMNHYFNDNLQKW
ncbi:dynamin GTPase [Hortaea werneckii]|nr:dynamin GTPase [Hortaea werneckii]